MAEKGAHLTQIIQSKPSIFDFIAQESFNDLLYPVFKKFVDTFATSGRSSNLLKWLDECFLLSHSLLQYYYLQKYGATFSEKFYGLQRIPINSSAGDRLGKKELWLSLATVSLLPYLRKKLNDIADEYYLENVSATQQKKREIFIKSVIYTNQGFNIFFHLVKFIQHLRFLSGRTDINSPILWTAGVKLRYAEEDSSTNTLTIRNIIPQILQRSLEFSAFFIQFLQWWQTEKKSNLNIFPTPPPPQKNKNWNKYSGKCPICLKKRTVDTALSTSGFVFCFKCITEYVMKNNKCPVTKLPTSVNNLIRIYPPE